MKILKTIITIGMIGTLVAQDEKPQIDKDNVEAIKKALAKKIKAKDFEAMNFGVGMSSFNLGSSMLGLPDVYLGVAIDKIKPVTASQLGIPKGMGLSILKVVKDTPAAKAGFEVNDVLYKLGDQKIVNQSQLHTLLDQFKAGDKVTFSYFRKGKLETRELTLEKRKKTDVSKWKSSMNFGDNPLKMQFDLNGNLPPEIQSFMFKDGNIKVIPLGSKMRIIDSDLKTIPLKSGEIKGLPNALNLLNGRDLGIEGFQMSTVMGKTAKMTKDDITYLLKQTKEGLLFEVKNKDSEILHESLIDTKKDIDQVPEKFRNEAVILKTLSRLGNDVQPMGEQAR